MPESKEESAYRREHNLKGSKDKAPTLRISDIPEVIQFKVKQAFLKSELEEDKYTLYIRNFYI